MTRQGGGAKRSSWLTFRRRLLLVRLLQHTPMTRRELIAAARRELGDEAYPEADVSALKHDLDALRREYGCHITYGRSDGAYTLDDLGDLALLDLPDSTMEALAFLDASFPAGEVLPEHAGVRELLDRILVVLPAARREQHQRRRGTLSLQLAGRASDRIDRVTLATVRRAVARRQELVFSYLGGYDDHPRRHRVAPYGVFFRPEGHGYLDATLLEATPPGPEAAHAAICYRLDRIVSGSARVLPEMLPPLRIPPPTYRVRYQLLPAVARRRDLAAYFPETKILYHEDGSATVTATVTNLWQARQTLLRHGAGCVVLEPPELVEMFRLTARDLQLLYGDADGAEQAETT